MKEKILTRELVKKLGLDKVEHITADMLEGYTEIGESAFYGCSSLTSVTIPNSVTGIGRWAFWCCSGLISVYISDVATWCAVSFGNSFANPLCYARNLYLNGTLVTDLVIPSSVTSIGDYVFCDCTGLTSVTISNSVTSIGNRAFRECTGLTSITIPESVTSIGDYAFWRCSGLTSVTIPNSVTSIGDSAFSECEGLTTITIPNSVTSIEDYTFYRCEGLTTITVPNSVKSIGDNAFSSCSGLTSITIGDVEYKLQEVIDGKCKAYKAFNGDMTCRKFQYEEGKTYEIDGEIRLCERGFHACLKLTDLFNYYSGRLGRDIHVHEVELEGVSEENLDDSKVVASKITIGKRII